MNAVEEEDLTRKEQNIILENGIEEMFNLIKDAATMMKAGENFEGKPDFETGDMIDLAERLGVNPNELNAYKKDEEDEEQAKEPNVEGFESMIASALKKHGIEVDVKAFDASAMPKELRDILKRRGL